MTDPHIHRRLVLDKLRQVLEHRTATGDDNPCCKLFGEAGILDLEINRIKDLLHAALDYISQVLERYLLRLASGDARYGDNLVLRCDVANGIAELDLQVLSLLLENGASLPYVCSDHVSSKRYHGGMPDNVVIIDGHISCAAAYIHQHNTGLLLLIGQHCLRRCKRLKHEAHQVHAGLVDAPLSVARRRDLPDHDVKVGFQPLAADADGITDTRFIINDVCLRNDMNDLLTHIDGELEHVRSETADVAYINLRLVRVTGDVAARHLALYMPPCDAHKDIGKGKACSLFEVVNGCADSLHRLFNVQHHTSLDPC